MAISAHTTGALAARNPSSLQPYRMRVLGDAMKPRFEAGDPVIVDPARPVAAGDDVVVWQGESAILGRAIAADEGLALIWFNAPGSLPLGAFRPHRVMRPNEAIDFLAPGGHC